MKKRAFNLLPGRSLGRQYRIVEFLGGGWEGEVYKVEEVSTGIIRAAKLFYNRAGTGDRPLLRYARKLYKLRTCPIVIQYHHRDVATIHGQKLDFLISDLANGQMLSSFLAGQKQKRLAPFEALHLFYALCHGVEQIHFMGEYHGDIHSDNVMVKRHGLGFNVHLLDFFDLGRATKEKIQGDVYDLVNILYEMIGEADGYSRAPDIVKSIIRGRKHSLIRQHFKQAGHLRLYLDNLEWDD